ncbi:MAG: 4Fe-4S binding protein [Deltaproteobacteria bacterium]|nr:4Fe-4S binding protein [Candidatus Anaeroferrophillus wilburensis]MBN2889898.1 4Fe-4S binding protein [Deltaproteobacteria bacterium]
MKHTYVLHFDQSNYDKPIVYRLIKDYDLVFNIVRAVLLPKQESYLVMEISGSDFQLEQGLAYLRDKGVDVNPVNKNVKRNEEKCIHCGACTAICPTGALAVDWPSMEVHFFAEQCSACGLCVTACPPRAMEVSF